MQEILKHMKQNFSLKAWVQPLLWTLLWGVGQKSTFHNMVYAANSLTEDIPSTLVRALLLGNLYRLKLSSAGTRSFVVSF